TQNSKNSNLQCEGHALAIQAIQKGVEFGFLDKKASKDEDDRHWEALGTLLTNQRTFEEWPGTDIWAEFVAIAMEQMKLNEKAASIRKNIENKRGKSQPKLNPGNSNKQLLPRDLHAKL